MFFNKVDREGHNLNTNRMQLVLDEQQKQWLKSNRNYQLISACRPQDEWLYAKPLQAVNLLTLRGYLSNEFSSLKYTLKSFKYDFENIIDDFIFLCFFVGNDFLPHLPSLDIREGAVDFLIEIYKQLLPSLGNF